MPNQGLPTNKDRAEWVSPCLDLFRELTSSNDEDLSTVITDFLADLMHHCDAKQVNFEECLAGAVMHHAEEVNEVAS